MDKRIHCVCLFFALLSASTSALAVNGDLLHGIGPINESMGGAGTGGFIDSLSVAAWNPAGSTSFDGGRLDLGIAYPLVKFNLQSSITGVMGGSTDSKTHPAFIPSFGYVFHRPNTKTAWHLGVFGMAGFGVDYPQENTMSATTNPMLLPQAAGGFGNIRSDYQLVKISLGKAIELNTNLSVGVALTPAISTLRAEPAPFSAPTLAGYPAAERRAEANGFGMQFGAHYKVGKKLQLGLSYSTPINFEKFRWETNGKLLTFDLDAPAIMSAGAAYYPNDKTTIMSDVRWINYADTNGYDSKGFNSDATVSGFGWKNIIVFGIGAQRQFGKRTKIRVGINRGQNPIDDTESFFNVFAPAVVMNHATLGLSLKVGKNQELHFSYYHAFENSITGKMISPVAGEVAGTSVTNTLSADSIGMGYSTLF